MGAEHGKISYVLYSQLSICMSSGHVLIMCKLSCIIKSRSTASVRPITDTQTNSPDWLWSHFRELSFFTGRGGRQTVQAGERKRTDGQTDGQTDGRMLPSALSPCFAKATRSIINDDYIFLSFGFTWAVIMSLVHGIKTVTNHGTWSYKSKKGTGHVFHMATPCHITESGCTNLLYKRHEEWMKWEKNKIIS